MKQTLSVIAALMMLATCVPPAQAAFHNATYNATGYAVDGAGNVFGISAHWHGFCTATFTVTVTDAQSGAVLSARTFRGSQTVAPANQIPGAAEFFVLNGASIDPGVTFNIRGAQIGHINAGYQEGLYSGTYQALTWVGAVAFTGFNFCD